MANPKYVEAGKKAHQTKLLNKLKAQDSTNVSISYNKLTDEYTTFLPKQKKFINVSGETHRELIKLYSNWDGKETTLESLSSQFNMTKNEFFEYKTVHQLTHDMPPFSKEELLSKDIDTLSEELLKMKKDTLLKTFSSKKDVDTKSAASKWFNYKQSVIDTISEFITTNNYTVEKLKIEAAQEPYALVLPPMDLHFGKGCWMDETGTSYSKEEARILLHKHTQKLISRVVKFGKPEKIVVPVGSDWFHIDNTYGTTTKGTTQDVDSTPGIILKEGLELAVHHIDLLRQVGPIELILCAGNHDQHSDIALLMFLYAWYRNSNDVTINLSLQPRTYTKYGSTILAFAHGNDIKPHDLAKLIPYEAKHLWNNMAHTALFTGHYHFEMSREDYGVIHYQVPSLSPADRWHANKGYVLSRRALCAYIIHKEDGPCGQLISPVLTDVQPGTKLKNKVRM